MILPTSIVRIGSILALLSITSTAQTASSSSTTNLRGLQQNNKATTTTTTTSFTPQSDCTVQLVALLQIPDEPELEEDEIFDCTLDGTDAMPIPGQEDAPTNGGGGGFGRQTRKLDLTKEQESTLRRMVRDGTLIPGVSKLQISGMQVNAVVSTTNNDGPTMMSEMIQLPKDMDVASKVDRLPVDNINRSRQHQRYNEPKKKSRRLEGDVFGTKPILVVKVTDSGGLARPETAAQISADIFGTHTTGGTTYIDNVNLKSQMFDCSHGQLNIVPGYSSANVAPGVMEVTIPIPLANNDRYAIHNAITAQVQQRLGIELPGPYEQVMYVIEKCYVGCGWAAYAYVNSWMSVYQAQYYKYTAVQVHEIGHNFGMAHSGGLDGQTYTDHTGMMGNPLYSDDVGKMCYNAAKNWYIGWYNDRRATLYPNNQPSTWSDTKRMVGVADYKFNGNNFPVTMKLETGGPDDYFIGFNRARGINSDNDEADDEVTIVQTGNDGMGYSQSWLKATLQVGESYTISNFGGQGKNIDVKLLDIDKSTELWTANVLVKDARVAGDGPVATPNPTPNPTSRAPTPNPTTRAPTSPPSPSPTPNPTPNPTNNPTLNPTSMPTTNPTNAPTPCPSSTVPLTVDVLTDIYPEETSWTLTNVCTTPNTIQLDAPTGTVYTATETQFVTTYCVPPSRYVLEMKDTYGDGMCCNYGNGGFSIEYRGNVVMTGGEFGSEIQSDEFGDVCPTPAPTTPPPSKNPTAQPTNVPSRAPTSNPTNQPSSPPTPAPSTVNPTANPTTANPTAQPTNDPTLQPTSQPSKAPTKTTPAPTSQPTSPPTLKPTAKPTLKPTLKPTAIPTNNPTNNPSISPSAPPIVSPPSKDSCSETGKVSFTVELTTDLYPEETSWKLTNTCSGEVAVSMEPQTKYSSTNTQYSDEYCLPTARYRFEINDAYGDGMCCGYGNGSYKVMYDGAEIQQMSSGSFGSKYVSEPFGDECPAGITPSPTKNPTLPPTPPPTPQLDQTAIYDSNLRVPKCTSYVGASCTSGDIIMKAGNDETFYEIGSANSLDGCNDGTSGSWQTDESIERISVRSVNGNQLVEGTRVEISATLYAYQEGSDDTADFYYSSSADLTNPTWVYIDSMIPRAHEDTLSVQYTLPTGELQAVRVNLRWRGTRSACSGGSYDDVDDLVFSVAKSASSAIPVDTLEVEAAEAPPRTFTCESINDKGRCRVDNSCRWFNGRFNKYGCHSKVNSGRQHLA